MIDNSGSPKKIDSPNVSSFHNHSHIYEIEDLERHVRDEDDVSMVQLIKEIAKQIKPGVPLYRLTIPALLVSPISQLEKAVEGVRPYDYLKDISRCECPKERFFKVLKWNLRCLATHPRKGLKSSKPYNPTLGEVFKCSFIHEDDNSESCYFAEQLSHHPPKIAYRMENTKRRFSVWGSFEPVPKLKWNMISVDLKGPKIIRVENKGEDYEIAIPAMNILGLFWGKGSMGYGGKGSIVCKATGFESVMKFVHKNKNTKSSFTCLISLKGEKVFKVSGSIVGKTFITDLKTGKREMFEDFNVPVSRGRFYVRPLSEQVENESRRMWHNVTYNIMTQDFRQANKEKLTIEERQRVKKKIRNKQKIKWAPKYFRKDNKVKRKGDLWVLKEEYLRNFAMLPEKQSSTQ